MDNTLLFCNRSRGIAGTLTFFLYYNPLPISLTPTLREQLNDESFPGGGGGGGGAVIYAWALENQQDVSPTFTHRRG